MPVKYYCDVCGSDDASEYYDGNVLCEYHRLSQEIIDLKREYKDKKKWVVDTWISKLKKIKKEIIHRKLLLSELCADREKASDSGKDS